ncbi:TetR/AcrR family transcriptional regulator C-terminal domain-containing protein [Mumia sp. zg.B53]|uniref:TetR/AcrR family transcriptional regulator C-terminal domain-containing protein n=1 Tax=unclassified Mumia TaxID=2621872 RepID=UPI001C6DEF2C|nr:MULTISPECIES: TetR/AcrR family transcriptional regulator C-terminal domain-containing protein [unclassified Mumia]MBW9207422.1 TetR/AcrR family transcriptional regulator C-terminal domain-containing protein [Mumia sp. zg.B17]MBW9214847.1 TetR/AcrR family transcriptional regulator C-terminal domain-containing protein [Mumia sp. zg.B53]MDD9348120.1 TetR/AcrR family transcriptional regulator C-terminal domain-containing protein [Mumia sp.]
MANSLQDVVDAALTVLDTHGLEFLSMRRVAAALDVQPSALYHHVPNKQTLLALMADEILARGRRDEPAGSWDERAKALCHEFRSAMLAVRDGAEVVATASAFGLGAREPEERLVAALEDFDDDVAVSGARTIMLFVLGHASARQMHEQASATGAIARDDSIGSAASFDLGLGLILSGLRTVSPVAARAPRLSASSR